MNRTGLEPLLRLGEELGEPTTVSPGGTRETHGYQVYPLTGPDDANGSNAVLLDIAPGGSTELEHTVRSGQEMSIEVRRGLGELVMYRPNGVREICELSPGADPVRIGAGAIYYYLNTGGPDEPLTVFDRTHPMWLPDDEVRVEQTTAELEVGDYAVVWNPRRPGGARTAAAWRVAVLEYHNTTQFNHDRLGQSKSIPAVPHLHALAQRIGEDDIYPVDILQPRGELLVRPRLQEQDPLIGSSSEFPVQTDRVIFMRPRG